MVFILSHIFYMGIANTAKKRVFFDKFLWAFYKDKSCRQLTNPCPFLIMAF